MNFFDFWSGDPVRSAIFANLTSGITRDYMFLYLSSPSLVMFNEHTSMCIAFSASPSCILCIENCGIFRSRSSADDTLGAEVYQPMDRNGEYSMIKWALPRARSSNRLTWRISAAVLLVMGSFETVSVPAALATRSKSNWHSYSTSCYPITVFSFQECGWCSLLGWWWSRRAIDAGWYCVHMFYMLNESERWNIEVTRQSVSTLGWNVRQGY